jgi:hypothetical protein
MGDQFYGTITPQMAVPGSVAYSGPTLSLPEGPTLAVLDSSSAPGNVPYSSGYSAGLSPGLSSIWDFPDTGGFWDYISKALNFAWGMPAKLGQTIMEVTPLGRVAQAIPDIPFLDVPEDWEWFYDIIPVLPPRGEVLMETLKSGTPSSAVPLMAKHGTETVLDIIEASARGTNLSGAPSELGYSLKPFIPGSIEDPISDWVNKVTKDNKAAGLASDILLSLEQLALATGAGMAAVPMLGLGATGASALAGSKAAKGLFSAGLTGYAVKRGVEAGAKSLQPGFIQVNPPVTPEEPAEPEPKLAPVVTPEPAPGQSPTSLVTENTRISELERSLSEQSSRMETLQMLLEREPDNSGLAELIAQQAQSISALEALIAAAMGGAARGGAAAGVGQWLGGDDQPSGGMSYYAPSGGGGPLSWPHSEDDDEWWKKKKKMIGLNVRDRDLRSSVPDDKTSKDGRSSYGRKV